MAEVFAEQPAGTPLLTALRRSFTGAFDRLPPEKRALEEVRMELARTVPEPNNTARQIKKNPIISFHRTRAGRITAGTTCLANCWAPCALSIFHTLLS